MPKSETPFTCWKCKGTGVIKVVKSSQSNKKVYTRVCDCQKPPRPDRDRFLERMGFDCN